MRDLWVVGPAALLSIALACSSSGSSSPDSGAGSRGGSGATSSASGGVSNANGGTSQAGSTSDANSSGGTGGNMNGAGGPGGGMGGTNNSGAGMGGTNGISGSANVGGSGIDLGNCDPSVCAVLSYDGVTPAVCGVCPDEVRCKAAAPFMTGTLSGAISGSDTADGCTLGERQFVDTLHGTFIHGMEDVVDGWDVQVRIVNFARRMTSQVESGVTYTLGPDADIYIGRASITSDSGLGDTLCNTETDGGTFRMEFQEPGVGPFVLDLTWPNCPGGAVSYHAEGTWDATSPDLGEFNNTISRSITGGPWFEVVDYSEASSDGSTFWWIDPAFPNPLNGNQPIEIVLGNGPQARPPLNTYNCAQLGSGQVAIRANPYYFPNDPDFAQPLAGLSWNEEFANCAAGTEGDAVTSFVTLDVVTDTRIAGSYSVTIVGAGLRAGTTMAFTGQFDIPVVP